MSADPVRDLWDAVSSANVRDIADRLYPTLTDRTMPVTSLDSCHTTAVRTYPSVPAADDHDVANFHRQVDRDEALRERLKHERASEPRYETWQDRERREYD